MLAEIDASYLDLLAAVLIGFESIEMFQMRWVSDGLSNLIYQMVIPKLKRK